MKKILVPIEFTKLSSHALAFALEIASVLKAKIILFHSHEPVLISAETDLPKWSEVDKKEKIEEEKVDTELTTILKQVRAATIECESIVSKGILADGIQKISERENIDLIVSGTEGAKGVDKLLFGSNSVKIFERVKCPVLFIPAKAHFHGIKKIMYATSFHKGDIKALKQVVALAKAFEAEVIVIHINKHSDKIIDEEENLR